MRTSAIIHVSEICKYLFEYPVKKRILSINPELENHLTQDLKFSIMLREFLGDDIYFFEIEKAKNELNSKYKH
jgi:hypothetical protein